jgi:exopolysaccharide biosynthesis polyprenyl glycosylphosphotransferase
MKNRFWVILFIISDWLVASLVWGLFFYFRKTWIEEKAFEVDQNFIIGSILVPLLWLLIYYMQGSYHEVRRMYRLKILNLTFFGSLIGTVLIFFILILDDTVSNYQMYYYSFSLLFSLQFLFSVLIRLILATVLINFLRKAGSGFRTVIIGGSEKAVGILNDLMNQKWCINTMVGYININGSDRLLDNKLDYLGHCDNLEILIRNHKVEEVIIAIESSDHNRIQKIITRIQDGRVKIKILPDMYELLSGSLKMTDIYGALLLQIVDDSMPIWQQALKRAMDLIISLVALILLIPLYITCALAVKFSSSGPIFYLQDRVGLDGRVFKIIKFRTMYLNSEEAGPQLSSTNDSRITKAGRFMRKTRLDEFPQFLNVILGHMSLVGPRPERQFYIDKIMELAPQYVHLTKVRPGITSWGQVKYGYAENVEQMLDRMKFDLLYLKNRSIALDIKIMFYTIAIVLKAKGK